MNKRGIYYILLVLLLSVFGMAGCGKSPKSAPPDTATANMESEAVADRIAAAASPRTEVDRSQWPVLVAFGDSLTFGPGVTPEESYPGQLQSQLDRMGYKYRVVNAGVSGDTSAGGINRLQSVLKHKPAILILELGANDGLRGMPVAKMKENLSQIIERLQQEKIVVLLAGMQAPPNMGMAYTQAFEQVFVDLAHQHKVTLLPFFLEGVAGKPALNRPDGIHPTSEGYSLVVSNLLPVLEPLLVK